MHILTEYSLWFIPLCLAFGIAIAYLLYHNDKQLKDAPRKIRNLLFVLRAGLVGIIAFLLLAPYIEIHTNDIKKPTIVVLQDNSASLLLHKDSTFYKQKFVTDFDIFIEKLKQTYSVDVYQFGAALYTDSTLNFSEKQTNLSLPFTEIGIRYYNANLGAIVLASDGIYNEGENPKYAIQNMPIQAPVYAIGLGDTVQAKDNVIAEVLNNKIAFKNNPFTIKVAIESHALLGKNSKLQIFENNKKVYETIISSTKQNFYTTIDCKLISNQTGQKVYKVKLQAHDNEISLKNNEYSFYVDVLESRQNILLLYESVHPDVGAIRNAIKNNQNYDIDIQSTQDFNGAFTKYNCIILHGMPQAYGKSKELALKAQESGIPLLFIYNSSTHIPLLETFEVGLSINNRTNATDETSPIFEKDFDLFLVDSETKLFLENAPPLLSPFGNYNTHVQSKVLCWQGINKIQTSRPLIVFSQQQGVKRGFICGDGLWRWRLHNYKTQSNYNHFDSFINKILAYLSLTQKRALFSVQTKPIFADNQEVQLTAELYNKSFEPVPNQEISITITNSENKEVSYTFNSQDNFYKLIAGKLPPDSYSYKAKVLLDGTTLTDKGGFIVMPLQVEFKQTVANHRILKSISNQTNGFLFYPNQFDQLYDSIVANKNIVSVSHSVKKRNLLLDLPLILSLLLLFASIEWFFRKYFSTY